MPYLNWIGRDAVLKHNTEIPYRLLQVDGGLSVGQAGRNLLIEGDNLQALKALLPYYKGRVKCVYIDPPYNTGHEDWLYNDNVNAPEMRAWLEDALRGVSVRSDDLSRHDKWLCMMWPRLSLLWELLSEDGSLWMSIDDNEVNYARDILGEIFGPQNFVATVIWQKNFSPKNDAKYFSEDHEYVVVFAKNKAKWRPNPLKRTEKQSARYQNPDDDPRGPWSSSDLLRMEHRDNSVYTITSPTGKQWTPLPGTSWRHPQEEMDALIQDRRIWFGQDGNSKPRRKRFLSEVKQGIVPQTLWMHEDVGHTQEAKQSLNRILGNTQTPFATPKSVRLIRRIIQIATNPGDLVLDSFAGSGTTGQAVLTMNAEDGGDRRFILVEMDQDIAQTITARRLDRAIHGYTWKDQRGRERTEAGLGGGFSYCRLGQTLFDPEGRIRSNLSFGDLAYHVFFTETGEPLPEPCNGNTPLIGLHQDTAYYLLWNGAFRHLSTLDSATLGFLSASNGPKVVYAESCRLKPAVLERERIVFKQIPYQIKVR